MTTAELKAAWLAFAGLYNQAKTAGDYAGQCEYWQRMEALIDVALEGRATLQGAEHADLASDTEVQAEDEETLTVGFGL